MATKTKKSKKQSPKNQMREAQVETADEPQIEPVSESESATAEVPTGTGKSHTLSQLAETYIKHMEEVGKSSTTTFAYKMELDGAIAELGEGARVEEITPEQVKGFFESPRVMRTKAGGSKALPTILKSRRVLRLALDYAVSLGWIAAAPIPSKELVPLC